LQRINWGERGVLGRDRCIWVRWDENDATLFYSQDMELHKRNWAMFLFRQFDKSKFVVPTQPIHHDVILRELSTGMIFLGNGEVEEV